MTTIEKKLPATFYRMVTGREPVRAWLKQLSPHDRQIVGTDLKTVEYGWPIGMPLCRSMGGGLWEVRSDISHGRISRVLFCTADSHIVLLHGFIKKSQQTPDNELELARRRMKEIKS